MHGLFIYIRGMKYFLYIFYRYYKSGSWEKTPYLSALIGFVFPLVLYVLAIIVFVYPEVEINKGVFLIVMLSAIGIGCAIAWYFIRPKDLLNPKFETRYNSFHGFLAILYIVCSCVLFLTVAIYSKASQNSATIEVVKFAPIKSGG